MLRRSRAAGAFIQRISESATPEYRSSGGESRVPRAFGADAVMVLPEYSRVPGDRLKRKSLLDYQVSVLRSTGAVVAQCVVNNSEHSSPSLVPTDNRSTS